VFDDDLDELLEDTIKQFTTPNDIRDLMGKGLTVDELV
jgi:hypothetical protein